jgi:hypothetical protein
MRLLAGGELLGDIHPNGMARVYSNQSYATVMLYEDEGHTVLGAIIMQPWAAVAITMP